MITSIALFGAIAWLLYQPGFEPAITSISLVGALASILIKRRTTKDAAGHVLGTGHYIYMDTSEFTGSRKLLSQKYSNGFKVWELVELLHEAVPEADPSKYGITWNLTNVENGLAVPGFGGYARDKGFLEEEARSLAHVGIRPGTYKVKRVYGQA